MDAVSLVGLSADALEALAKQAAALARDLRKKEPTYALALAAGVVNRTYNTVRFGDVASYSGEAIVTMADGSKWRAVGYGPTGGPDWIKKQGGISFTPLLGSD